MTKENAITIDLQLDNTSLKNAEKKVTDTMSGLQYLANNLETALNNAFAPDADGMQNISDSVSLLTSVLACTTIELQNLALLLTEQHEENMWTAWYSDAVDSLALMVELYAVYQTLLAITGALTVAGTAQSAAWTIVNAVETVSVAVTSALSAVMTFLTSPIGLVVIGIASLIAIIVLLVQNWDTVKAAALSVWEAIKEAFGNAWKWFKETLLDPLVNGFKGMVNGIIGFINGMIGGIVDGINLVIGLLNKLKFEIPDWVPVLGGMTFGFDIPLLSAPQIPYLAKGAVLPANRPFLAMVGDQRHGTNIEAPLATIQEAVALVMEDLAAQNAAGQRATVEMLRNILEAVLGIQIGDDVIGRAASRYNRKMAIARGGY